ncbi:MAG TPA: CoA-binding protein, partial [Alphaproteobacteria bacterium]|nr:CoA-binding protein [Alphaproteobacteria bacterium]
LPEVPDHVVIGVASRFVEAILDQAIGLGVKAATIFAACYLDDDDSPHLSARIAAKAAEAGMAVCGANCMGFYTPSAGLRVASAVSPSGLQKGGIAWIAQSGSAFSALPNNDRRLGFTLAVSTGMELVTTVADYMDWALHQPETRVIGLFVETIRDPAGFLQAL